MSKSGEDSCLKVENEQVTKSDHCSGDDNDEQEHDPQYDPVISLPEINVPTLEEEESVMVNLRAKVYRYDAEENPPEWKERGTGNIKMLHHKGNETVRIVMRRDKTLKLCANHFITPHMELKPSASCERAWIYSVNADYIDKTVKSHLLAVKFCNVENAKKWKNAFDAAKKIVAAAGSPNNQSPAHDKKPISEDALKLNDTFDDEKKTNTPGKEKNGELNTSEVKMRAEVAEKLTSLSISETRNEEGDNL